MLIKCFRLQSYGINLDEPRKRGGKFQKTKNVAASTCGYCLCLFPIKQRGGNLLFIVVDAVSSFIFFSFSFHFSFHFPFHFMIFLPAFLREPNSFSFRFLSLFLRLNTNCCPIFILLLYYCCPIISRTSVGQQ